jgi:lipopolysaccharide/colanic/teichoic acid biosynthesis glycosyltransferase
MPERAQFPDRSKRTRLPAEVVKLPDLESQPKFLSGIGVSGLEFAEPVERVRIPLWKRGLDLTCILLSLPVWLPVTVFVALWVKIVAPGPLFFRQERVGYRGRRFMILKFRTMGANIETLSHERHLEQLMQADSPLTKLDAAGDPRIIRGGRVLRALQLDKLPQLLSVFRGDMSLVGPRPCTPAEFLLYQPWQRERLNAPPGLISYWVNGANTRTFAEMIDMDLFYLKNMSLGLDLQVMLRAILRL